MIEINLLPGATRKGRSGGMQASELIASASQIASDKYTMGAAGGVIAALAIIGFLYIHQGRVGADLDERELKATQDSSRYSALITAKTRAEASRDSLFQQLSIIKSIDDTRFLWSHVMEELSGALPPYTWLTSVTQTSIPPSAAAADTSKAGQNAQKKKGPDAIRERRARSDSLLAAAKSVKFRVIGNTVDIQALTRFIKALEGSAFIQNVQLARSDLVVKDGKEVTEFQLDAETQTPPPYAVKTVPLLVPAGR